MLANQFKDMIVAKSLIHINQDHLQSEQYIRERLHTKCGRYRKRKYADQNQPINKEFELSSAYTYTYLARIPATVETIAVWVLLFAQKYLLAFYQVIALICLPNNLHASQLTCSCSTHV